MTLVEIKNQLFTHFLKSNTFSLSTDLKRIKVDKDQDDHKHDIILTVLRKMEQEGKVQIVNPLNLDKPIIAVLSNPWTYDVQQVLIGNQTAELVAEIINQYREASGITEGLVDKTQITEGDIQTLAIITAQMLNAQDEDPEEREDR